MNSATTGSSGWRTGEVIDGRYEVLEVLGHGGMGVVHRVRHRVWGTDLAVKSPRPELIQRARDRESFVAEAEVWASLGLHPNVCGCHYVRTLDGVPRVFAEYVAGGSLAGWIATRRLYAGPAAHTRIVDLAIQMAWGLAHAHSHDLVHQDVKPANVLLDMSADGALTVKVTDFGLARARAMATTIADHDVPEGASILVSAGGMTPAYASPEQAGGNLVGRRSDIYSFAVSVLEMFTGGVTWMAGPVAGAALAAHRAGDPDLPELPAALAELLARCLHVEPTDRPASMAVVAGELAEIYHQVSGHAYPRTQPVEADLRADELNNRGVSLLDLGRQAEAAAAFEAATAADPHHLEATYNDGLRLWRSGAIADDVLISRLEATRTASGDPWLARYLLAEVQLERGDRTAARELLRTVEPGDPGVANALRVVRSGRLTDARCVETHPIGWHEYEKWVTFRDGTGGPVQTPIMRMRFTADGRRALALSGKNIGLWDIHSGQPAVRLSKQPGGRADVSADGRFALCGKVTEVRMWDLARGKKLWQLRTGKGGPSEIAAVALSADARLAAVALYGGDVFISDARTGRVRARLGGHASNVAVEFSPDGRFVLTSGRDDATARLWDTTTGACVRELRGHDRLVSATAFSPDGRTVAMARYWENIGIWDLTTGQQLRTLTGHARMVESLAWSDDGRLLLSGAIDGTVRLWEPDSGRCLRTFPTTATGARAVLFEPGTDRALAAGEDTVCWWTLPSRYTAPPQLSRPRRHAELTELDAEVTGLVDGAEAAIAAGRYAEAHDLLTLARATRGHERAERVLSAWRSLAGVLPRAGVRASWRVRELTGHSPRVFATDLSADGACAATGDGISWSGGMLRVWDTGTGQCLRELDDHPSPLTAVRLSPDRRRVLSATRDGQLAAWSIDTGECLMKISGQQTLGAAAAHFSEDGRWALTADNAIRLWDMESGECVRTVTGHDRTNVVWLSPDARRAVSGGADKLVRVWDLDTGECLHSLTGHAHWVMAVSLSPDGRFALSCGGYDDRTVRLWDVASGACLHVLDDLPGNTRAAQFTDDGRFVISGDTTGALRIWDVDSGQCRHTLDTHQDGVYAVALTPDGRFAVTGGGDPTLRLWEFDWDLAPGPARRSA